MFPHFSPSSLGSPRTWCLPHMLLYSQTRLRSLESVMTLTVLPFLSRWCCRPTPFPILSFLFHLGWHNPEEKHRRKRQTLLSSSNIPKEHKTVSHLLSCLFQLLFSLPPIKGNEEQVISKKLKSIKWQLEYLPKRLKCVHHRLKKKKNVSSFLLWHFLFDS